MLRGHYRYEHVEACAGYHEIANPMISPIKGVNMRFPRSMENSRQKSVQLGPLLRSLHPVVPDNGWHNCIAAFRKRCNYFNAGRASPYIVSQGISFVRELVPVRMKQFDWNSSLFEDWLCKFGEEKRNRMVAALHSMDTSSLKDYTKKDIFVKVEALLVLHKPNWAPRVIFKGTDLYNVLSGPIFNELMKRFDFCLESMAGPYRFKTSYKKVATDYTSFLEKQNEGECWLEADFTSNDKFQCSDVQLLEVAFMRELGCPEWFVRLHMKSNKFTVKSSKHGISASLENQLPTGATDTTFRNSFWNGCILWAFLHKVKAKTCRAMIMGDDMLANISGLCRYAVKIYTSVASDAMMEAKVFRQELLYACSFLSKFFVPCSDSRHLTIPILGKAIGRFNMRANRNESVSDHAYMAGKSVGYAYEFRYLPPVRDMFLKRFMHEFSFLSRREKETGKMLVDISWNARVAGVTLKNITRKIVVDDLISDYDFYYFCKERYHLTSNQVLDLFEDVVLNDAVVDLGGIVVETLAKDFLN